LPGNGLRTDWKWLVDSAFVNRFDYDGATSSNQIYQMVLVG